MVWKLAAIWDLFKDFNEKYQENFVIREFATALFRVLVSYSPNLDKLI